MTNHKDINWQEFHAGTSCVWGGEEELFAYGASQVPVFHTVTYGYPDVDTWQAVATGKKKGYIYSRNTNPTVDVFEEKVRILERAEAATSFATGMAAVSNTLFTLLSPGDRVVSIKDSYGGTSKIFMNFLPRFNVDVQLCNTSDHEEIEREIAKGCQVLYLESPTNPTLKILDIARLAQAAKKVGAKVVVDNTFATPINQRPLELGADIVLHSATKFLGGHSDAMGGVICSSKELVRQIFHFREINGATLHPMSAYLLIRGLKTLELRVNRQNSNAMKVAEFLDSHPEVDEVFYPGLPGHRFHDVAKKQMRGFGGMLSFSLQGEDFAKVERFLGSLKFVHLAASLGSVGTLAGPPRFTSHAEANLEERKKLGISETLIRYSVGIEDPQDLIADLKQALEKI